MEFAARLHGVEFKAGRIGSDSGKTGVGGYCGGKDVEGCRKVFGDRLPQICSTCPN